MCSTRYSLEELEGLRAKKADEKGGFAEKIFLEYVDDDRVCNIRKDKNIKTDLRQK